MSGDPDRCHSSSLWAVAHSVRDVERTPSGCRALSWGTAAGAVADFSRLRVGDNVRAPDDGVDRSWAKPADTAMVTW
jgi:hypothetical protein